jgi:predicted RNA methylase
MRYYAAFVPGMQEAVAEVILKRLPGVFIEKLLDGAVVFETGCSYDRLNFLCFNNIFAVIDSVDISRNGGNVPPEKLLEAHIVKATGGPAPARGMNAQPEVENRAALSGNNQKIKSFRIIFSVENKPVSVKAALKQAAELFIARESGLVVNRAGPDTEFWFLYRREGFSLFMKRLTRHAPFEKTLHPGELTPQLAWLLCDLSNPKHTDVVVDPFCGYGSIPDQRIKHFPFKKMYALDINAASVSITKNKLKGRQAEKCEILKTNMYDIFKVLSPGGADAVITDPPWGLYRETSVPPQQFYDDMTAIVSRLLKEGGRAVILTARKEEFELSACKAPELRLVKTFHVLVSGKKAAVYVLEKQQAP